MRHVGTVVRGIRTPIIKYGDNLEDIVIDSIMKAKESEGFQFRDKDVIAITEAVVGITEGNYVNLDQIAKDIKNKFENEHVGILFPTPVSRNRFSPFLKGIARGCKKLTIQFAYPGDEVGNKLFPEEYLEKNNVNPYSDVINEETYLKLFNDHLHEFTGVNYIEHFREIIEDENCSVCFVFSNNPKTILDYTKNVLVSNIYARFKTKKILKENNADKVFGLDDIMNESVDGSGYNSQYGLLGSNRSTDETLKLFPITGQVLVENIQNKLKELTGKTIEVMVYGDGAFKDPVGGIWELADPCVSPAYTDGLVGTPNELKIKYISDNKLKDLHGKELEEAMKNEIKSKENDLVGQMASQGTTPRRYTDLLGSLCDLTSGSGDKGTPVVFIQGYFDSLVND
jgi:Uncharacterized conserved protein